MSQKHPRTRLATLTSPTARRVAMSVVVAGLATTLVLVYLDRSNSDDTVAASVAPPPPSTTSTSASSGAAPVIAALNGAYDVTITVASAEYGATWPKPPLVAGQLVNETWAIVCLADTCSIGVASGHIAEDPHGSNVSTIDGQTFSVSLTSPAGPDSPSLPAGCGAVDATDIQQLTLTAVDNGATFTGRYEVHHPTFHVEGPVPPDGTGSCDSFNVVLDITAQRI